MTDELVARLMALMRNRVCICGHNGLDHYTPNLKESVYNSEPPGEFVAAAMIKCRHSDCGCQQMLDELPAGPELDLLIAEKVMAKEFCSGLTACSGFHGPMWGATGPAVCISCQRPLDVPKYSADISAAWEVLKEFGTGRAIRISSTIGGGWRISFSDTVWENRGAEWDEHAAFYVLECVVPNAEDLPLAICRAALKAVRK